MPVNELKDASRGGEKTELRNLLVVIIILLVGIFAYLIVGTKRASTPSASQTSLPGIAEPTSTVVQETGAEMQILNATDASATDLVKKVFKHIFLPSGDVRIETVNKPEELRRRDPVFYEFVSVGDKMLIYKDRIILYNPGADKVLDVKRSTVGY